MAAYKHETTEHPQNNMKNNVITDASYVASNSNNGNHSSNGTPPSELFCRLTPPATEKEKIARAKLLVDRYDVEAWEVLATEAQMRPISEAAPLYEQLLAMFPTAGKYWKLYVDAQMHAHNDEAIRRIFSRCLLNCLHVGLWTSYIRFIYKANENKGAEGREQIKCAYDFMLSHIGTDISSGPLWMEYIAFLKILPASNVQEESTRTMNLRIAYQKAILTPTHNIEQLWKDYESFENSVSRAQAKAFLADYQPKYVSARAVYRERKKLWDSIDLNKLAVPPTGSLREQQQCSAWRQLLVFEKGNPQRIDSDVANRRVICTYEQCLMYLYHYPDIWYDYAMWHSGNGTDSASKIFERALKALPDSEVLRYAYAELEESRGQIETAKKVYESLLSSNRTATALSYIQFIRFIRRTEGVEAARKCFSEARKSPNCTYHVFVAYAMMAFCLDKDSKVAHNVFEQGLKRFMHEPAYIIEYADFLCRLNDDRNVRALFERALNVLPPGESTEVWNSFLNFEQQYGDLKSMLKVEQRRKEALSRTGEESSVLLEGSLQDVVSRYSFLDLWPCSTMDLNHISRQEWLAKNINGKSEKVLGTLSNVIAGLEKNQMAQGESMRSLLSIKTVKPDLSRMRVYDPRQNSVMPGRGSMSGSLPHSSNTSAGFKASDDILRRISPLLASFIVQLPSVTGPLPDVDMVISTLLQSDIQVPSNDNTVPVSTHPSVFGGSNNLGDFSNKNRPLINGSSSRPSRMPPTNKRREPDRQEEDDVPVNRLNKDVFRMRQMQRARNSVILQTGSTSGGSGALAPELSGSTE